MQSTTKLNTTYFIPGLGFNEEVIAPLLDLGLDIKTVNWIEPLAKETIQSYAKKMSESIDTGTGTITLIGYSFGGIIAQEISQIIDVDQIILISTCKSRLENSLALKALSPLKFNKVIKKNIILKTFPLWASSYGYETPEEMEIFRSMIKKNTDTYLDWAVKSVSTWERNFEFNVPIIHIHGDKDRTFPIKNINDVKHIVKGGDHFMIYKKAKEIALLLKKYMK